MWAEARGEGGGEGGVGGVGGGGGGGGGGGRGEEWKRREEVGRGGMNLYLHISKLKSR